MNISTPDVRLRPVLAMCVCALLGLAAAPASAVTLTWDADPGTAGIQDGDGAWWGTGVWWNGATNTNWMDGSDAVVGSGAGGFDIDRDSPNGGIPEINSLTFNNDYEIVTNRGDRDIRLVGDAEIVVPSGVTVEIETPIQGDVKFLGGGNLRTGERTHSLTGFQIADGTHLFNRSPGTQLGKLTFLDTSGSADATFRLDGNLSTWSVGSDIEVLGGSTGTATFHYSRSSGSNTVGEFSGDIVLGDDLHLARSGSKNGIITFSGNMSGPGGLVLHQQGGVGDTAIITGNALYDGATDVYRNFQLDGTLGNANITLNNNSSMTGTGTLMFNVEDDTALDMVTLLGNAMIDLSQLTLLPMVTGTQSTELRLPIFSQTAGVNGQFADTSGFVVDYADPNGPTLIVPQTTAAAIPEPAVLTLLGLAGLALVRRRR